MPCAGKQNLRIARTDRQIGNANVGSLIEHLAPMRSSIDGLVDAAFRIWAISMTECADVNHVRILRIHHDAADLVGVLQTDVRPGCAAIGRFVDAVTGRQIGTNVGLAGSSVDGLGIRGRHGDRADRSHRLALKNRSPYRSGIRGFPDTPIDRAKIKSGRVPRHTGHGNRPAPAKWPNQAPFEPVHQFRRNRLGNR